MEKKSCCKTMQSHINFKCERHTNPWNCPDYILFYLPKVKMYGIPIQGTEGDVIEIKFCPWCGKKLPKTRMI